MVKELVLSQLLGRGSEEDRECVEQIFFNELGLLTSFAANWEFVDELYR